MLEGLPGIAANEGRGKIVCVSFGDTNRYYDYISYFYPDGEYGATAGVHLRDDYPHFVLNHAEQWSLEVTLVPIASVVRVQGRGARRRARKR